MPMKDFDELMMLKERAKIKISYGGLVFVVVIGLLMTMLVPFPSLPVLATLPKAYISAFTTKIITSGELATLGVVLIFMTAWSGMQVIDGLTIWWYCRNNLDAIKAEENKTAASV